MDLTKIILDLSDVWRGAGETIDILIGSLAEQVLIHRDHMRCLETKIEDYEPNRSVGGWDKMR